MTAYTLHNR